jgi:TetR/AcrR family fatty acid metabolism transcriptional regulator
MTGWSVIMEVSVSPRPVNKDEKRAEILDAAIRVFARAGFHPTKIEDVAREAGVAKGTIYLYFTSRDDILAAAFERFADEALRGVRALVESAEPALDRLRALVRAMVAGATAEPELARIVFDFWAVRGPGAATVDFARIYAEYRRLIALLLDRAAAEGALPAGVPEQTPAVLVGLVEGVLLQWLVDPAGVAPGPAADAATDLLLAGLTAR